MSDIVVISKSSSKAVYVDGGVNEITLSEIDEFLATSQQLADLSVLENNINSAEQNLVSIVNEIDTKVSEREAYINQEVNQQLADAAAKRDIAVSEAYRIYNATVDAIKKDVEKKAADICSMKEEALATANLELDNARKAFEEAKALNETYFATVEKMKMLKQIIESAANEEALAAQAAKASIQVVGSAPIQAKPRTGLKF